MSLNGSIGPVVPSDAYITYGVQLYDSHRRYHYQVGQRAYTCVSIPNNQGNCPEKRRIYHELYYAAGQIFNAQYANMQYCEDIKKKVYNYTYDMNLYNPHMIKYMGKITIKPYEYFEFQTGDQLNILTRDHRYISIDTRDPAALFSLAESEIYDIGHFIPQELIKRRGAQQPAKSLHLTEQAEQDSQVAQHAGQNTTVRQPRRLNATRYIAGRRARRGHPAAGCAFAATL